MAVQDEVSSYSFENLIHAIIVHTTFWQNLIMTFLNRFS